MSNKEQPKRKQFTCAELIITVVIIGVLVIFVVPAIENRRKGFWKQRHCEISMKQLYTALHCYHDEYQSFPPAFTVDAEGKPLHSWRVLVLPYLEAENLYRQIRMDEPWDSEYNRQFHDQMPNVFHCLEAPLKKGDTNYMALTGPETYFPGSECRSLDDSALDRKTTVLLVETATSTCWMAPIDGSVETMPRVFCYHSGGGHIAMADGKIEYVKVDNVLSAKREMQNTE